MAMPDPAATAPLTPRTMAELESARLTLALNELQAALPYTAYPHFGQSLALSTGEVAPELAGPKVDIYNANLHLLHTHGIAHLGRIFDAAQAAAIRQHLDGCPCFAAHVATKSDGVEHTVAECAALGAQGAYRLADIVQVPHLIEFANRDDILSLMETYLGCVPSIYSMNAFWTFPDRPALIPGLQTYHRDYDDFRFCTMFIFLTDTAPGDGAHFYARATHRAELVERRLKARAPESAATYLNALFAKLAAIDDVAFAALEPQVETVSGPAGTVVLEDTFGLHKGEVPKAPRLLAWIRYGLYKNNANLTDKVTPVPRQLVAGRIPDTPRHRYINRLIIEP
jgi:hypothetical protein